MVMVREITVSCREYDDWKNQPTHLHIKLRQVNKAGKHEIFAGHQEK